MARPEKPINWDLVDELIQKQNSGAEIASHFNLYPDTFYDRVKSKWDMKFTDYAGVIYSQGKSLLKNKQWDKAMEGNVQMLLRLGEVYLNQKGKEEQESTKIAQEISEAIKKHSNIKE